MPGSPWGARRSPSTLLLWWVPLFGYEGAAWAHLACYGFMVVVSYMLGRRIYPVPYQVRRVLGYIVLGVVILGVYRWLSQQAVIPWPMAATLGMAVFLSVVYFADGRRLLRVITA